MTHQNNLLDKYYSGESTLTEEQELKELLLAGEENIPEQDFFGFFDEEAMVPAGLEDELFEVIKEQRITKKKRQIRIYSMVSAAAVVLILFTAFLDFRSNKKVQMEDNFFVMEQALFQISESLQPPAEQEEMLVLWVDNDVEIIIN